MSDPAAPAVAHGLGAIRRAGVIGAAERLEDVAAAAVEVRVRAEDASRGLEVPPPHGLAPPRRGHRPPLAVRTVDAAPQAVERPAPLGHEARDLDRVARGRPPKAVV